MMLKLGFDSMWVKLIMLFVTTVHYRQPNGTAGPIIPSRGLYQGDLISPCLFLICAKGLSYLLQAYAREGLIHGCRVDRLAPNITHLFFADDSLLFFKATPQESEIVKLCLKQYEEASGQTINCNKSLIVFSPNVTEDMKTSICSILNVASARDHGKYPGAPSLIGSKKVEVFDYVKKKAVKCMFGWRTKFLSRAGKEVLLKSVVQAIPNYVMSIFLLPTTLCDNIEKLMNKFW